MNEMKIISIFVDMKKKKPTKKTPETRIHPNWYITKDFELISSTGRSPRNLPEKLNVKNHFLTKKDAKTVRDLIIKKPKGPYKKKK
jgi:hypothetical protein